MMIFIGIVVIIIVLLLWDTWNKPSGYE